MRRRKYLAAVGLAAGTAFAGCSGETGSNNSSGSSNGSNGGSEDTEASGGSEETEASSGGEETAMSTAGGEEDGDSTSMATSEEDGGEDSGATATSGSEEDSDTGSTSTQSGSSDSGEDSGSDGESSSISDSGDTDVTLEEVSVDDGLSLDSAAFYNEDDGFSVGVEGEVTNESDSSISYMEVSALFYDSEGTRLDDGLDNLNDFQSGETYRYDAVYLGTDGGDIASYSLEVTSGF